MSRLPDGADPHAVNLAARGVLLDALTALAAHSDALVVVGAQAVDLRCSSSALQVASFTSDADLSIDNDLLPDQPTLDSAMRAAAFRPNPQKPGTWERDVTIDGAQVTITVDLLVAATFTSGRRAARLPPHRHESARLATGLEAAAVDNDPMLLPSLQPDLDGRTATIRVAGIAALLIAKAYKIDDRLAESAPGREADKDAGDVVRLLLAADPNHVGQRIQTLLNDARAAATTTEGLVKLRRLFGARRTPGTNMAAGALAASGLPEATIRATPAAFLAALPLPM